MHQRMGAHPRLAPRVSSVLGKWVFFLFFAASEILSRSESIAYRYMTTLAGSVRIGLFLRVYSLVFPLGGKNSIQKI